MATLGRRAVGFALLGGAAVAVTIGPTMSTTDTSLPSAQIVGAPCVNGVVPLNPYIVNCNLPLGGLGSPAKRTMRERSLPAGTFPHACPTT
jgi:hypothetical protein